MIDEFLEVVGFYHFLLFVTSAVICIFLIYLARYLPMLTGGRRMLSAIQASHVDPTPRVGGIAIFASLFVAALIAPIEMSSEYLVFMMAACVLFVVGLIEDLTGKVSPRMRLLAAAGASCVVIFILDIWMPRIGIPPLDWVASYAILGIPITLLITVGMANGFNLIDGVNGLASFSAMVAAAALAVISYQAGYDSMSMIASFLFVSVLGFFIFNFPFGKIFLGDAGAYTIGFVLSWCAIAIVINAPQASPWALLLTLFWPVADTCLAITRRMRKQTATTAPDRLHFHHLVMRALEIVLLGRNRRPISNSLSTIILAPFILTPALAGIAFWDSNRLAFIAVLGFSVLFGGLYVLAFPILRKIKRAERHLARQDMRSSSKST